MSKSLFSVQLREELLDRISRERDCWELGFRTLALSAARFQGREMRFSSRQKKFALLVCEQIEELYAVKADFRSGKEQSSVTLLSPEICRAIKADMQAFQEEAFPDLWEDAQSRSGTSEADDSQHERLAVVLAELFLSCGALSSPQDAYQLEFSFARRQAALFFERLFRHHGMNMRLIRHRGYHVLYAKDGQGIADFLLYSGAHGSLLTFEELRVEKEVFNQVNRVVNCDNANAQRLADSSAIQRKAILRLQNSEEWRMLPPELVEAGMARLDFPELSLAELGQKMNPPIGKSGMNHRLKKMISLAERLSEKRPGESSGRKARTKLTK